jgi:antitoxin (DNA-binding transcriptional repressor) of toxin-antitoxin stability system
MMGMSQFVSPPWTQLTLADAQQNLSAIIPGLQPGEEVQILQGDRPIARLTFESTTVR